MSGQPWFVRRVGCVVLVGVQRLFSLEPTAPAVVTPHRSGIFPGMTLKSGAKYHLAGTDRVTGEEEPGACEMGVTRGS